MVHAISVSLYISMLVNVFKPVRETFAHTPIYYVSLESLLPHEDDDMSYPHTKTNDNIHLSSGRPGKWRTRTTQMIPPVFRITFAHWSVHLT